MTTLVMAKDMWGKERNCFLVVQAGAGRSDILEFPPFYSFLIKRHNENKFEEKA